VLASAVRAGGSKRPAPIRRSWADSSRARAGERQRARKRLAVHLAKPSEHRWRPLTLGSKDPFAIRDEHERDQATPRQASDTAPAESLWPRVRDISPHADLTQSVAQCHRIQPLSLGSWKALPQVNRERQEVPSTPRDDRERQEVPSTPRDVIGHTSHTGEEHEAAGSTVVNVPTAAAPMVQAATAERCASGPARVSASGACATLRPIPTRFTPGHAPPFVATEAHREPRTSGTFHPGGRSENIYFRRERMRCIAAGHPWNASRRRARGVDVLRSANRRIPPATPPSAPHRSRSHRTRSGIVSLRRRRAHSLARPGPQQDRARAPRGRRSCRDS